MNTNLFKSYVLPALLFIVVLVVATGCKKDKITVDQEKRFVQVDPPKVPATDNVGGTMHLTLKPDGIADILPFGDIVYRGTYKIKGDKLKVEVTDLEDDFEFKILNETDIKLKNTETVLRWER